MHPIDPAPPAPADSFAEDPPRRRDDDTLFLRLESYEGPIDLLLEQARDQKVDLTRISILALANQYLDFIERARSLRLELAADYLVMAAWLAYLKSRLLLPKEAGDDEPSGEELAEALAFQLQRIEAMRKSADRLDEGLLLHRDLFPRGVPEDLRAVPQAAFDESLYELLSAYGSIQASKESEGASLRVGTPRLVSVEAALARLVRMLGQAPDWTVLQTFLPPMPTDPLRRRSAVAATFGASLELAKSGRIELRQDGAYGPIFLRLKAPQA